MIAALLPIMFTFILGPCQCYNLFVFFTHGVPMTAICLLSILYFPNIKLIFNGENLTFKKIYISTVQKCSDPKSGVLSGLLLNFLIFEREKFMPKFHRP